jgi:tetratricopeptide (TPR) repeat protein
VATETPAAYDPILAAQSVEVGDYYFSQRNYHAALSRYQEALESKPDDAAIYLRLGRAFENLSEATRAFESYDASLAADPAGPSAGEARKSAERLRPEVEKRGDDPGVISARNRGRIVPRCRTETAAPSAPSNPPR